MNLNDYFKKYRANQIAETAKGAGTRLGYLRCCLYGQRRMSADIALLLEQSALGSNHCKPPFWIGREGKRGTDLLSPGHHAAFCIISISSRRKGVTMIPNRTAGTSPVVQCGRTKLCCSRCTSKVRCRASVFLA